MHTCTQGFLQTYIATAQQEYPQGSLLDYRIMEYSQALMMRLVVDIDTTCSYPSLKCYRDNGDTLTSAAWQVRSVQCVQHHNPHAPGMGRKATLSWANRALRHGPRKQIRVQARLLWLRYHPICVGTIP